MALIGKIKEKSGWAIGFIAIALGLFVVGGDILGPNSFIMGNDSQRVGTIAGQDISIQEFQQELDAVKYNYSLNTGRNPTEEEMAGLREQAWNQLIQKIAYKKQYDKLGLAVTNEEIVDMVQGDNIHPAVKQAFVNPANNEFDRNLVVRYLKSLDTLPPQQRAAWFNFESQLGPERLRSKYENLLQQTAYVTKEEAQKEYIAQTAKANVKFVYVPFFSIPDSTIKVTDDQLKDYLNRHKSQYKGEETRTIEYVTFSVLPSAKDSAFFYDEIKDLAKGLASAQDDSTFARNNTDVPAEGGYIGIDQIPQQLQGDIATFIKGGMYGPYREGDTYSIYKLSDIKEDTAYSVRASHILFRADSTAASKAEALKKAREVLQQIKNGASFEEMARIHGADATAQNGGDLGWFSQGRMVPAFEKAVFSAPGTGLIPNPVETQFGYHLIKVTQPKTNKKYKLATIKKTISAGDATREEGFRRADEFAGTTNTTEEFRAKVKQDPSLSSFTAEKIRPGDNNINTLTNAREIVRWAFSKDTEIGDVSKQIFELPDQYVVATLVGKTEDGEVDVDDFRAELTSKVKNEIKAEQITKKLASASGSLDEIAKAYGPQAQVNTAQDVTLNSSTLQNVGFDPVAVGKIFGLKQGQKTKPFSGENGVLIVEMTNFTPAPEIADYTQYKNQVAQTYSSRTPYYVTEAIKDEAKIKDNRYKFY